MSVTWCLTGALVTILQVEDYKGTVEAAMKGKPLLLVAFVVSDRAWRRIEGLVGGHAVYVTVRT